MLCSCLKPLEVWATVLLESCGLCAMALAEGHKKMES